MAAENQGSSPSLFAAVRSSVLAAIVRRLDESGQYTGFLLSRHGIPRNLLDDPYAGVPIAAYLEFFEAAAQQMRDADLGARLGTEIRAGDVGPVGLVLSLSASMEAGLRRFTRYTSALQQSSENAYVAGPEAHVFSYRVAPDKDWPRRQDAEFSLVSLMQILRASFGARIAPMAVHFEHPAPASAAFLTRYFRCPLIFGQAANRLLFDPAEAERPVRPEDDALIGALERHIRELLGEGGQPGSAAQQVSALIGATLGRDSVSLARIAARLGETPRTLQRKLAGEGTSFRALLEDQRRATAERLLAQGIAVGAVAQAVGYADGTALWRARQGWGSGPARGPEGS